MSWLSYVGGIYTIIAAISGIIFAYFHHQFLRIDLKELMDKKDEKNQVIKTYDNHETIDYKELNEKNGQKNEEIETNGNHETVFSIENLLTALKEIKDLK